MKKIFQTILFYFLVFLYIFCDNQSSQISATSELPSPEKLLSDVNTAYKDINNYSYTIYQEGWDVFNKERDKAARKEYSEEAEKKYSRSAGKFKEEAESQMPKQKEDPAFKKSKMEFKFMKPYLSQMTVVDSDYVPGFMNGSMLTYRPDNDPKVVWFKFKYLLFAVKRPTEAEYGSFYTANWSVLLMIMDYYSKNGQMKIAGIENYKGNEAYKLVFTFNVKSESDVQKYEIDYKKREIPTEIKFKVDTTLEVLPKQKFSSVIYWIDTKRKIVLGREEFIEGKLHWREWYENIKLNSLTKKDF